ncbi:succinate-semialdehyde dehydrogenase, mitochondrial isoform X1 [Helianthus annuus]|uniref:succinate-semialdehyde dehydrogenase, mitochondrial isoform X1 n=2 Tax=Helianthus annuus TaxID=4232 RepID=UPI0016531FD9|nr:succinate-semialdehyde dehydrogenase, mitochondrial isoform X1 [Helianthus annuus]XP_035834173.1 succinate-semialdehyde dehydrogenase, mitochondrial isoform X1 [Helianthus annuus]XP_035834174.1 succinate-semialdehyde dehydrogenase, mitochondrial isoform X1 [Helianthus annuus]XP_035834176.1 succinate-semialdehyde dehydrogenase, mitochondrial isoform X1 [Helianthus annuus]XP_035834177.1 succinate-semialdehyde dehydrogenase, mitochondrial isoform X1 [Helianthus annuus]XP_035834179.1 succinate-
MIARKVGPALASGCTLVIKPSELTPLIALAAAELALQLGIPPGVLNVVMGDPPSIGVSLLESTQVRKITFTGSTGVGKKLMAGASETVKKVSLELGRNAPCIIFDDADLELAVKVCQLNSITLDNNVYAQIEYLCKKRGCTWGHWIFCNWCNILWCDRNYQKVDSRNTSESWRSLGSSHCWCFRQDFFCYDDNDSMAVEEDSTVVSRLWSF